MPLYLSDEAMRAISGHLWTIAPWLRHQLRPGPAPATEPFRCSVPDARLGTVSLGGRIRHQPDAGALLVVVHGLGGCSTSHYAVAAALAAERARLSCLRIDLRGASGDGEDFYHGGLDADLAAVLAAPEVQRYPHVYVLGYSMGGHLALRLAALRSTPRLRAVVALCPPLDLGATGASLDRPDKWIYRQHVLRGLRATVGAVAVRRPELVPIGVRGLAAIRTLREWDERVVAPRHGFRSADHYYAEASVAPHLGRIELPALMVQAEADPMIPASTVRPALAQASRALTVRWVDRGGHVGFPARTDLTLGEPGSVEAGHRLALPRSRLTRADRPDATPGGKPRRHALDNRDGRERCQRTSRTQALTGCPGDRGLAAPVRSHAACEADRWGRASVGRSGSRAPGPKW